MDSRLAGIRASSTAGFEGFDFTHDRKTRRVLRHGAGPGVLLMHELPGMTPACLYLAKRIACAGFSVYLPLLFGEPGEHAGVRNMLRLCVSQEFTLLAADGNSPVTAWLRSLCRHDALETTLRFLKDRLRAGGAKSSSAAASTRREA